MNVRKQILKKLRKNQEVTSAEIVGKTGFSRTYVNRFFQELVNEGLIVQVGSTHHSKYIPSDKNKLEEYKCSLNKYAKKFTNILLTKPEEDSVIESIKKETGIFVNLNDNIKLIVDYGFTEMMNNAIEHSNTDLIDIKMERENGKIKFSVIDHGVGIFNNIKEKLSLNNHMEAIQDLLKGKQTTFPERHTGEGIFFTSKAADLLLIQSSNKQLIFNNLLDDIFIKNCKETRVTKVKFVIDENSNRNLTDIFWKYTDREYDFSKTGVMVNLYKEGVDYISRSQARRIISGLNKFKTVTLDFKGVDTVGQAFADEIFRIWQSSNPGIEIKTENENENVRFMIERAKPNK